MREKKRESVWGMMEGGREGGERGKGNEKERGREKNGRREKNGGRKRE